MLRGPRLLPIAMFFGTFSWSFVYISLPFHIQRITTTDAATTLRWTGWILGITPLVTVLTAPLWGRYAGRGSPMRFYVVTQLLQGLAFFGMAAARTLPELFLSRLLLGIMGAASTFAFIISGRAPDPREVRRQVAAVQSAMTVGQVIGPLAGAIAAARLGFRQSFVLGGFVLFACAALVRWGIPESSSTGDMVTGDRSAHVRDVLAVAAIVLGASTQIFFLVSILPQILPDMGVRADDTLETGGILIFASGAAAALGSVLAPRLSEFVPERKLLIVLLVASSVFLAALAPVTSIWLFGALRFLQVLCIAPVFPIVVAGIAQRAGGQAIGLINSARIGAAFVGPVVATTILTWTSPWALYLVLAAIGIACLPVARLRESTPSRMLA